MTAEQLRNSILQEAISGRLVPQDPNDEPASVLLQHIREEKARLVKEGKLKKKDLVETPITEEEIPFEIPSSWEWVRLKNIVSILGDGIHGTPEYDIHGEYFFVNGNNLSHNKIVIKGDTKRINHAEYLKYKKILNETTVLVSINGTIGNIGHYNGEPVILGKSACYFNLMNVAIKPYITLLMYTDYFLKYAKGNATGSTIKNVSLAVMNNFLIPLPPLAEQKRIVAKLEELLPIVEQYGKAQTELDELNAALPARLRTSILQEAMQGKLVPNDESEMPFTIFNSQIEARKQGEIKAKRLKKSDAVVKPITEDEIPFEIPSNWTWYRLSDLANMYTGDSINAEQKLKYYTNVKGMEYIATKDVKFNHEVDYSNGVAIPDERRDKFRIAPAGSILLCVEGGSAGRKIATIDRDVCFGNKLCCFATYTDINPFLYYYLQSPMFKDVFRNSITGIIGGVAIKTLRDLLVPLPPLDEQARIVAKIEELFAEIDKLSK